jgi:hypothetical protein
LACCADAEQTLKISDDRAKALTREIVEAIPEIRATKKAVLATLVWLAQLHGIIFATIEFLIFRSGATRTAIHETLTLLRRHGFLKEIVQRHLHGPTIRWFPAFGDFTDQEALALYRSLCAKTEETEVRPPGLRVDETPSDVQTEVRTEVHVDGHQKKSSSNVKDLKDPAAAGVGDHHDFRVDDRRAEQEAAETFNELVRILGLRINLSQSLPAQARRRRDILWVRRQIQLFAPYFVNDPHVDARRFIISVAQEIRKKRPDYRVNSVQMLGPPLQVYLDQFTEQTHELQRLRSKIP